MAKFFHHTVIDNRGKDFSSVDISYPRGSSLTVTHRQGGVYLRVKPAESRFLNFITSDGDTFVDADGKEFMVYNDT